MFIPRGVTCFRGPARATARRHGGPKVDVTDRHIPERQAGIADYLAAHPEVSAYVVVDDQDYGFPADLPLVKCDSSKGLSDPGRSKS